MDMRIAKLGPRAKGIVVWSSAQDPEHPFSARVGDETWVVRVNDFPEEVLYTLLIDGRKVASFDDWPPSWRRPTLGEAQASHAETQNTPGVRSHRPVS